MKHWKYQIGLKEVCILNLKIVLRVVLILYLLYYLAITRKIIIIILKGDWNLDLLIFRVLWEHIITVIFTQVSLRTVTWPGAHCWCSGSPSSAPMRGSIAPMMLLLVMGKGRGRNGLRGYRAPLRYNYTPQGVHQFSDYLNKVKNF